MTVWVVFADEKPDRNFMMTFEESADERRILHVVDSLDKAKDLAQKLRKKYRDLYTYVDYESFEVE